MQTQRTDFKKNSVSAHEQIHNLFSQIIFVVRIFPIQFYILFAALAHLQVLRYLNATDFL